MWSWEQTLLSQVREPHLKIQAVWTQVTKTCLGKFRDKSSILQDAPFSTNEFNEAWKQLCAFETLGHPWLPTPSALAMTWMSILSAVTLRGLDLEKSFDPKLLADIVANDGYPQALCMAVMTQLVTNTEYQKDDREYKSIFSIMFMPDNMLKGITLSRDKVIEWVGDICLQRVGESDHAKSIPQSDFLAQWQDLLPEHWRKHASTDVLKASYSVTHLLSRSNEDAG